MSRDDVWVAAWCAVASGWNSKAPDATRYADICLKEFDERFPGDSDGTATAAANGDLPVPKDCQARAEGIAQNPRKSVVYGRTA